MARVWIDIENPPQVQYLLPFKAEFEGRGHEVVVTARRHGITEQLLAERGVDYRTIGAEAGKGSWRKVAATLQRGRRLARAFRGARPDLVLTTSRAGALAGRRLGRPVFTLIDYEHANLVVQRAARCRILFPEAIGAETFVAKGFPPENLIPFPGLKEAISFAGVDVAGAPRHDFGPAALGLPLLLFRPPAELAHYFSEASSDLATAALETFARRDDVQLVLSPRYPHQAAYLTRFEWRVPPIRLDRPVPFVSLLRSVDAVMSSGGTMLREAAYLGVPAYSIFRSAIGAVDRSLVDAGRLRLVESPEELEALRVARLDVTREPMTDGKQVLEGLVTEVLARAGA